MRILLDECMPRDLLFSGFLWEHSVSHVLHSPLSGFANGELLSAASGNFDLFITSDKHFRKNKNLQATPQLGIICLRVTPNTHEMIAPALESLLRSVPPEALIGHTTTVWRDRCEIK